MMDHISRAFEWIGVTVIVLAFLLTLGFLIRDLLQQAGGEEIYARVRTTFGRGLLLGLEVLVAADLIRTVAVEPTMTNVTVLGILVDDPHAAELLAGRRDRRDAAVATSRDEVATALSASFDERHRDGTARLAGVRARGRA